jgi:ABC-2 type transport system permease protein
MTEPTPTAPATPTAAPAVPLSHRVDASALATLFALSVERLIRGRRLLVLLVLLLLPTAFTLLARRYAREFNAQANEEVFVFYMIPQALLPLTLLVFASGIVQDEVEEQTLTYLLIRPLPRWAIYLVKLAAVVLVSATLVALGTSVVLLAIHWGTPELWGKIFPDRALRVGGLFALAALAYGSLFGCLSLIVRRSMSLGIAYILVFEGLFANVDFVVRKGTVMYYIRVLASRWLGLSVESWSLDLDFAPTGRAALLTLLIASAVAAVLAAAVFTLREFRLKTPEGS